MSITKPKRDARTYDTMTLSNGLKVFIISDGKTKTAASSMSVNVGSYSDPDDYEGIAHFLEHMLFQGSSKYPDTNTYNKFINENGGSSNAFTASEITVYHFDIMSIKFDQGLDIFSRFFIDPLFKEENLFKEMNAVNSEHSKNINSDTWRQKRMVELMVNTKHPMRKFSCGTLESLQKENIRDIVIEFYKNHYTPSKMYLTVLWDKPIDAIKDLVNRIFNEMTPVVGQLGGTTNIPAYSTEKHFNYKGIPMAVMTPVENRNSLSIAWVLPDVRLYYKSKPDNYISFLLGHEGFNSLAYELEANGYSTNLNVGIDETDSSGSLLNVSITLTNKGNNNTSLIIKSVYDCIKLIKTKNPKSYYEELKKIGAINFECMDSIDPATIVQYLGTVLHFIEPNDAISYPYIYEDYDKTVEKIIKDCLDRLVPSNSFIIFNSPNNKDIIKKQIKKGHGGTDKYYGFEYVLRVANESYFGDLGGDFEFGLPAENPYCDMVSSELVDCESSDKPKKIKEDDNHEVWFKCDNTFNKPEVLCNITIYNDAIYETPKSYAACLVFISMMDKLLKPFLYDASLLNSLIKIDLDDNYININMVSKSGIEMNILAMVLKMFLNGLSKSNYKMIFASMIEDNIRSLSNYPFNPPVSICDYFMESKSCIRCFDIDKVISALSGLSEDDVMCVPKMFFGSCRYSCLVQGNATEFMALKIDEMLSFYLYCGIGKKWNEPPNRIISLKPNERRCVYDEVSKNPNEENSATLLFFEYGNVRRSEIGWEKYVCNLIFVERLLSEKFFNELRTNQQLGYIVKLTIKNYGDIYEPVFGLLAVIQSPIKNPDELDKSIMEFMDKFDIELFSSQEFESIRESILSQLREDDSALIEEFSRNITLIRSGNHSFDSIEKQIEHTKNITFEDIKGFYKKHFSIGGERKIRCSKLRSQKN